MRTIFKALVLIAATLGTPNSAYSEHKDHNSSLGFLSCEAERSTPFLMLNYIVIEPTTWERLKKTDEPETDEKWVWIYQIFSDQNSENYFIKHTYMYYTQSLRFFRINGGFPFGFSDPEYRLNRETLELDSTEELFGGDVRRAKFQCELFPVDKKDEAFAKMVDAIAQKRKEIEAQRKRNKI